MANDFLYEPGTIASAGGAEYRERAQQIVPILKRLLDGAREAGVLVIYATDAHQEGDLELRKWPPHSMKGTKEAEIVEELKPQRGDIVLDKTTYSPFCSTNLDEVLKEHDITQLYITGLHTDCCCRHTSGDAFQRGYEMVWVTDALQAFTEEQHQQGLEYFKAWYATDAEAQLKTADQVLESFSVVAV
jgi:nicotinamidase-related amidase